MMSPADLAAEVLETAFRLVPFPTRTGVRIIGRPDRMSPVLLTGNYDLTVRRVVRAVRGLDAYLIVAPSHGVNVWCASSGGHLGTHQVVTALKVAGLEDRVVHREVIVPQLAATGVEAKQVRRRTGWIVRFGPADARDLPAYLHANKQKTDDMRHVRFRLRERLEMAAAWAAPTALVGSAIFRSHAAAIWALVGTLAIAVFVLYDRLPFGEPVRRGLFGVLALALVIASLAATGSLSLARVAIWGLGGLIAVAILTFDFAGSSPTEASGLFEERAFHVALNLERCTGAYNCWAVCPEACFDKLPDKHKVAITHADRCIRCGACIVQCPQDALAFETDDGRRVEPDDTRRYKLNLLGKRAKPITRVRA